MTTMMLAAILAGTATSAPYRDEPRPGIHHYVYQATETVMGGPTHGYRTEFDLQYLHGAIYAVIRAASVVDGSPKPVEVDPKCRSAMHGDATTLARVRLVPLSRASKNLGASFLPMCAPAGIFFPLTDILNVVLIPTAHFNATRLKAVGQSLPFPPFTAAFDRPGIALNERAPGGEVSLAALNGSRAALEWKPGKAKLDLVEEAQKPPVHLEGTEHFAFRVEVDRWTGVLARAAVIYDNLDLKIVGTSDSIPALKIVRAVSIEPRSGQDLPTERIGEP